MQRGAPQREKRMYVPNRLRTTHLTLCILFAITSGNAVAQAAGSVGCPVGGGGSAAAGAQAVACGYGDSINGNYSTAFGDGNQVFGDGSSAFGSFNQVGVPGVKVNDSS